MDRGLKSVALGLQAPESEAKRPGAATQQVHVSTDTLSAVIDRSLFDKLTFMSIDVEGAGIAVLKGLDLRRHCPDLLLIETDNCTAVSAELHGYLHLRRQLTFHDFL